jgi:hypothetical protein
VVHSGSRESPLCPSPFKESKRPIFFFLFSSNQREGKEKGKKEGDGGDGEGKEWKEAGR